jgi:hypothetical protein
MNLREFVAATKRSIFEELSRRQTPSLGTVDAARLADAFSKGRPQMGATNYQPDQIEFEFIFPDPGQSPVILVVSVVPPERIVFMPVPDWVVEDIWQGEISGSFVFASDCDRMLHEFHQVLQPDSNSALFSTSTKMQKG